MTLFDYTMDKYISAGELTLTDLVIEYCFSLELWKSEQQPWKKTKDITCLYHYVFQCQD